MISLHQILHRGFSAYDHAWCFFPLGQSTFYQKTCYSLPCIYFITHVCKFITEEFLSHILLAIRVGESQRRSKKKCGIRDTGYEGRDAGYRVPSTEYRVRDTGFIKNDQSPYSNMGTPKCHLLHVLEVLTVGMIFSPTNCTSLQNFLLIQIMVPRGTYPAAAH